MRTFSTAVLGELNKQYASEPLVVVEIEWEDGAPVAYCDRKLNGEEYPYPLLVSVGNFASQTITSGSSDSQSLSITLDDTGGTLRQLLETKDIHLNKVLVYLSFQGLPFTEKALMFEGVINSAIVWDEGARTLTFDVLSKLEDAEVGFTMDDGDFPYIPPNERNKAWPLVFGQVCNMQAVRVTAPRKGYLGEGQGVMDFTIEERLCQAQKLRCSSRSVATTSRAGTGGATQGGLDLNGQTNVKAGKEDQSCINRRFEEICNILREREQQSQYVKDYLIVRGGNDFPQDRMIALIVDDVRFEGIMTGETFDIQQTYHPDRDDIQNPVCKDIKQASIGYRYKPGAGRTPNNVQSCDNYGDTFSKDVTNGAGESWRYYEQFEKSRFIWLPPGTEVYMADEAELVNIVSLLPGTVDQVAAYRTFGDTTLLVEVPTEHYTVYTSDFGGYDVVEVRLRQQLSTILDEDWQDDLYVSFTSSVGPNPVDIIEWIVGKYTGYTVDAANFATIKSYMTNYPSNFFLKERMSALKLIRDIAYQARMGVVIRNNVISLVYLSREPSSLKTISNSTILPNTFRVTHSETEDLKTSHEVTWSNGEAGVHDDDETEFKFTIKHNVPKYGTIKEEHEYYTQNTFDTIYKSATFWMIRDSNTWKYIEFETPLMHLDLDIFDCFTINVPSFPQVKCVVTETSLNAEENTVKIKAWTPVLAGTNEAHYWAWPATRDQLAVFPLLDSSTGGDGSSFTVTPPVDHPLRAGYNPETARRATDGDRYPSDIGDVFPTLECQIATGAEIAPDLEPVFTPLEPVANEAFADNQDQIAAGGLNSGGEDDREEKTACGDPGPDGAGCQYEVTLMYVTPEGIAPYREDTGGFSGPCNGTTGSPCFGPTHTMCHIFGAAFAAQAFASAKRAEARALKDNGGYTLGKSDIYSVYGPTGIPGDGYAGECEEDAGGGGDPAAPGAGAGETQKPKCKYGDRPNCGCPEGQERTAAGACAPDQNTATGDAPCSPGLVKVNGECVPDPAGCPDGYHPNQFGNCVENQ